MDGPEHHTCELQVEDEGVPQRDHQFKRLVLNKQCRGALALFVREFLED